MKNGGRHSHRTAGAHSGETDVDWRQLAQYGVSHALNDLFSLPPEARTAARIEALVERRWTNRGYKFASREHYHHVKLRAVQAIGRYARRQSERARPLMLFETAQTRIAPLAVNLSLNMQLLWSDCEGAARELVVHKFVIEDQPQENETFFHMATLFCHHAFGRLPRCVEVLPVLGGGGARYEPSHDRLQASYDYLRLIKDYMKETEAKAPLGRQSCRS